MTSNFSNLISGCLAVSLTGVFSLGTAPVANAGDGGTLTTIINNNNIYRGPGVVTFYAPPIVNLNSIKMMLFPDGSQSLTMGGANVSHDFEYPAYFNKNDAQTSFTKTGVETSFFHVNGELMMGIKGYDFLTFVDGVALTITKDDEPVDISDDSYADSYGSLGTMSKSAPFSLPGGVGTVGTLAGGNPISSEPGSGSLSLNGLTFPLNYYTSDPFIEISLTGATVYTGVPTPAPVPPTTGSVRTKARASAVLHAADPTLPISGTSVSLVDGGVFQLAAGYFVRLVDVGTTVLADGSIYPLAATSAIMPSGDSSYVRANGAGTFAFGKGSVIWTNDGTILRLANGGAVTLPKVGGTFTVDGVLTDIKLALSGKIDRLKFKMTSEGGVLRVKAAVTLSNHLRANLHMVTATVYVSEDAMLSSDDVKLATLNLADYLPNGGIGKRQSVILPFSRKVPAVLSTYLAGKYLIIDLDAADLPATGFTEPIVIGPIQLP